MTGWMKPPEWCWRFDGTQTGVIAGIVDDSDGTQLQGVQVELVGPQIQHRAWTDVHGRFRFLS